MMDAVEGDRSTFARTQSAQREMDARTYTTAEAAAALSVSTSTLRAWERKFGFPRLLRSTGNRRRYPQADIISLRDALREGLSVESAIGVAQDSHGASWQALVSALASVLESEADRVMEASLSVRSVERTIDEVLLPALSQIEKRRGLRSALWSYAAAWATAWLLRARRLAGGGVGNGCVLVGDGTTSSLDPLGVRVLALALCCKRAGLEVVVLATIATDQLREVVAGLELRAAVTSGAATEVSARWTIKSLRWRRGFRYSGTTSLRGRDGEKSSVRRLSRRPNASLVPGRRRRPLAPPTRTLDGLPAGLVAASRARRSVRGCHRSRRAPISRSDGPSRNARFQRLDDQTGLAQAG